MVMSVSVRKFGTRTMFFTFKKIKKNTEMWKNLKYACKFGDHIYVSSSYSIKYQAHILNWVYFCPILYFWGNFNICHWTYTWGTVGEWPIQESPLSNSPIIVTIVLTRAENLVSRDSNRFHSLQQYQVSNLQYRVSPILIFFFFFSPKILLKKGHFGGQNIVSRKK